MSFRHILATALVLSACAPNDPIVEPKTSSQSAALTGTLLGCDTLWAGQSIDAGEVCVTLGTAHLSIDYATSGDWGLDEVHAWVGTDPSQIPTNNGGNPQIGQFPYQATDLLGATSYSFLIPLEDVGELACDDVLAVAAHAAVSRPAPEGGYQTETGWAGDDPFAGGSWASLFTVTVTCDPPDEEEEEDDCETAFALGDTTFIDLGLTQSRWGWQLGPLAPGSYSSPLYAGAGQNDLSKGTVVGTVDVDYDGSTATVSYTMDGGYSLDETHVYVGTSPVGTIAPGQYGNTHDLTEASDDSFSVTGFSGEDLYVVAHGVSCEAE